MKIKLLTAALLLCCQLSFADQLIIEPDAGRAPIVAAIEHANSSVELAIYGLTDHQLIDALIQAQRANKNVAVLLESHPYKSEDENVNATRLLNNAHVSLQAPSENFKLLHEKALILDHHNALVMTFNFTHSAFKQQRNFALVIDNPSLVQEIDRVFIADRAHQSVTVSNPDLVWSPDNAREKILQLIRSATTEIDIYAEDVSDYQIIGALAKAARGGVRVRILLSAKPEKIASKKFAYLERAGVEIHNSNNLVIHAKVIIIDQKRALVGSINLTKPSINDNRELSVITHDATVVKQLTRTFDQDYGNQHHFHFQAKHKRLAFSVLRHFMKQLQKM